MLEKTAKEKGQSNTMTENTTSAVTVIQAGVEDIARLAPLFDGYRQFYEQPSDVAGAESYLKQRLERCESVVLLALLTQGTTTLPAGFTQLYPSFSSISMQPVWILNDLFVAPEARRFGVGRALMERARQFASETGAKGMVLETAVTNTTAQALYESLGWQRDTHYYTYELAL